jgi:hypothetical protein
MANIDVDAYAKSLLARVGEAQVVRRAEVRIGERKPLANMCHHNVTDWCESEPTYQAVRGWLYFDLPGCSVARFVAHSVVHAPDGELYDITPSNASQDYPFLKGKLSEEEFAELVEKRGYSNLHTPKGDA